MKAAQLRSLLRWSHIIIGLVIGTYVYSPLHGSETAADVIRWIVIPALVASGLAMWKQGPLTRLFTARQG